MSYKDIVQELCTNLEKELNQRKETNQKRTVELFSGLRTSSCDSPAMYVGNTKIPSPEGFITWYVDLKVDDKLIFRQVHALMDEEEDDDSIEEMLMKRVLRDIFTFGVMSSKQFIDEHYTNESK